jgi:hypothetical protein
MEAALRVLIPKIAGNVRHDIITFQGKSDLLQELPGRLGGYRKWSPPGLRIVVVVDRDNDDCLELKRKLEAWARQVGFVTKSSAKDGSFTVVNRIAIEELEAWFFGDWEAVRSAYPKVSPTIPEKQAYRFPDDIHGGTWEALERVLRNAGYYKNGLPKVEAATNIARHMDPKRNQSRSFQTFVKALE